MGKSMIFFSFLLVLTIISGCPGSDIAFEDFSKKKLKYRVVSLTSAVERRKAIDVQFKAINDALEATNQVKNSIKQEPVEYAFIDAILGKELDKEALAADGYYKLDSLRDGELGLFRTTTESVIPMAMSLLEEEIMVVLEDDVVLPIDLDFSFRTTLKQAPSDWDILYLGCFKDAYADKNGVVSSPFTPAPERQGDFNVCDPTTYSIIPGSPWVKLNGGCVPGTWAYALRKDSGNKLNELLNGIKPISVAIDLAYRSFMGKNQINVYCLHPELVRPNYVLPSSIR